ncbi:hypothetical protein TrST_g8886 [Triparma strigata]|uniref:EF-hand domain-containing protein n=1 Tax=Triparma strigata TaxID=1606541 RepID=A0A9W7C376_9STRA|nr:hypothetical protein TrST_g8886 [Triparma strigata]
MGNCQGGKPHTSATYELPPDKFNSLDVFCKQLEIRPGTLTKLRVAFTKIDHDKSGCVSMAEFLVLFGLDRTPFTTRAFRLIDNDRSGELDFFEFVAAVWNYCTMDWETLVRYSFDLFDTDGSGQLETEEIERLVCYVAGTKKPDARAKKVLKLMDHDNDGLISYHEFLCYNRKFQSILFPAFNMQVKMRKKVMGLPFWEHKTLEMAKLKTNQGISVRSVLDDLENGGKLSHRKAERVAKKRATKGKEAQKKETKAERAGEKKEELPKDHQFAQPAKPTFRVAANEKLKKKHKLKAKDGLILKTYDIDDDFECSGTKKQTELKSKSKSKKRKPSHSKHTAENHENSSRNTTSTISTSVSSITTEYIDFKIGSNPEKESKKKKKSKPPTTVDIRKQQRDMAEKEVQKRQKAIDTKFKRKNPKMQSFAQKNLGLLSTNQGKENDEVNSPPPLPMEDQIRLGLADAIAPPPPTNVSDTWKKLGGVGRKPLQPRRPRPLNTPPNKKNNKKNKMSKSPSLKKSLSAMFSPEGKLGKSMRAASDFISSPFSAKKTKKRMKKSVQFDSDLATTIVFSETPTKLTISEFR